MLKQEKCVWRRNVSEEINNKGQDNDNNEENMDKQNKKSIIQGRWTIWNPLSDNRNISEVTSLAHIPHIGWSMLSPTGYRVDQIIEVK